MPGISGMAFVWLGIAVVFGIIELATVQLTTVWFAAGAVVAMILAVCGVDNLMIQILVFVAVSVIALIATRPLVKKLTGKRKQPTNADRSIGKTVIVTSEINNENGEGIVTLSGVTWSARSEDGSVIPAGEKAVVKSIEGVKLIVSKE